MLSNNSFIAEALQFHTTTQSQLVQWVNNLLPVQGLSSSHPGDAQTHNGTGFLLLALSRYISDPNVIDHWPCPRLRADNGKLHQALRQRCEKPAVNTHSLLWFHSTPCMSSYPRITVTGQSPSQVAGGEPCGGPAMSHHYTVSLAQRVNHLLPVQVVSGSYPGDAQTHNGTGFLLLALSRYIMVLKRLSFYFWRLGTSLYNTYINT